MTSAFQLAVLASTHTVLGVVWLTLVVAALHRLRRVLTRRPVRRATDTVTGTVGFGVALAVRSR